MMQIYLQDFGSNETAFQLEDPHGHSIFIFNQALKKYYTPVMVLTGFLGNTLCYLSLRTKPFVKVSAVPYMMAVVMADSIFLIALMLVWLSHFGIDIYNADFGCHGMRFFTSAWGFLVTWVPVCLITDRLLISYLRDSACRTICTPLRAKVIVIVVAVISVVINVNISLLYGVLEMPSGSYCLALPQFASEVLVLMKLDICADFALPFIVMLVGSTVSLIRLARNQRRRRRLISVGPELLLTFRMPRREIEATKLAGTFCIYFITLNAPAQLLRLISLVMPAGTIAGSPEQAFLWQQLCVFFIYSRAAFNLPILAASSKMFRTALTSLFDMTAFAVICFNHASNPVTENKNSCTTSL